MRFTQAIHNEVVLPEFSLRRIIDERAWLYRETMRYGALPGNYLIIG